MILIPGTHSYLAYLGSHLNTRTISSLFIQGNELLRLFPPLFFHCLYQFSSLTLIPRNPYSLVNLNICSPNTRFSSSHTSWLCAKSVVPNVHFPPRNLVGFVISVEYYTEHKHTNFGMYHNNQNNLDIHPPSHAIRFIGT